MGKKTSLQGDFFFFKRVNGCHGMLLPQEAPLVTPDLARSLQAGLLASPRGPIIAAHSLIGMLVINY